MSEDIETRDKQLEAEDKPPHRRVMIGEAAAMIDEAIAAGRFDYAILCNRKAVVAEYELQSGYTIPGRSAMIDPIGFDIDEGLRRCRERAIATLQAYLAFHTEQRRYEDSLEAGIEE